MLGINVLYSAKSEVLSVFIPCFIPEYDAVLHARIIAKMDCSFSPITRFWACYEAYEPHFSALYTPKLHLCTHVPMPGTPFSPYPKPPFGISHFTIWGILWRVYDPYWRLFLPLFSFMFSQFSDKNAAK